MKLLLDFKKEFNEKINQYLCKKIEWSKTIDKKGDILFKIIQDFINLGGKRFRPALFYYAYKSYSNKNLKNIFEISFAFEIFHTFALIHDDIIDNSTLRRGSPTVHKKYDMATAILAGDLALMISDEIFNGVAIHLKTVYNDFKQELIIGQYLDTKKIVDINKIMELKTARYSFIKPATMGMMLAGADKNETKKMESVLKETGLLFQLKDDYIGIFGNEKTIGKTIISDFIEKKNTVIVDLFKKCTDKESLEKFNKVFGNKNYFDWYLDLLKKEKIDSKVQHIINNRGETILKKLEINFKDKLLAKLLKEIIFNILDFS